MKLFIHEAKQISAREWVEAAALAIMGTALLLAVLLIA